MLNTEDHNLVKRCRGLVHQLRQRGYLVYISHERVYDGRCTNIYEWEMNGYLGDFYYNVERKGGFTRMDIITPEGENMSAKYNFPKHKNYWRALGVAKCLMKLSKIVKVPHPHSESRSLLRHDQKTFLERVKDYGRF